MNKGIDNTFKNTSLTIVGNSILELAVFFHAVFIFLFYEAKSFIQKYNQTSSKLRTVQSVNPPSTFILVVD